MSDYQRITDEVKRMQGEARQQAVSALGPGASRRERLEAGQTAEVMVPDGYGNVRPATPGELRELARKRLDL